MATSTSISLILLVLPAIIHSFNPGRRNHSGQPSPRTSMPPLFYTDIEPEISAITIPSAIHINGTSIFAQSHDVKVVEQLSRSTARVTERRKAIRLEKSISVSTSTQPSDDMMDKKPKESRQPHRTTWQLRYDELKSFKEKNGHCLVPQSYIVNRKLGLWVMAQRRQYALLRRNDKRSSLKGPAGQRRIQLLEDIGFVWRVDRHGPRGAYGSLRLMKEHADTVTRKGPRDEILDAVDFGKYMMEKREAYSEKEMRLAWRRRFEIFQ